MLPKAALMPPWAATVWDRVGNNFEMHAVFRPASARPTEARRPAPPAPTTRALLGHQSIVLREKRRDRLVVMVNNRYVKGISKF